MTTWVFLRGLTREARHWSDFPARFRATFDGEVAPDDILTPDLPGNGRRWHEPSPCSVEAMMQSCRGELLRAGHAPPFKLLALSLGGMVAVSWARRYPDECRALVLISTSLRPWSPFHERLRPSSWLTALRLLGSGGTARERAILELTSARAAELGEVLPAWTAYARESPVSRRSALCQLLAAARFRCRERPDVPLLLLAGAGDRLVNPRCSQVLAHAWGADLALHPDAGHDLPLDDSDWVAQAVRRWSRA